MDITWILSFQFLGDPETVKKAMEAVAAQGKAKWEDESSSSEE